MRLRTPVMLALSLLVLASVPWTPAAVNAESEALLVVASAKYPANNISYADLKSAFRGQPVIVADKRIVPVNHPLDAPLRVAFDRIILGLKPVDVGRFWVDMRIRDQGRPPTTATSAALALRVVASLDSAITYATKSSVTADLKVLTVDGRTAGQPGYRLEQ